MKVIVHFKSGLELPITCEEFSISTNPYDEELDSYTIKGIKDNKPVYIDMAQVDCIWREVDNEIS